MQNSSAPKRSGAVATNGMSVVTPARRNPDPNRRLINEPCLPSSPKPEAMAGGMRSARTLPRDILQFAIRMLVGWMPEERRRLAGRRFTQSVNRVARNLEQGKRFRFGAVTLPLGASWVGLIGHN